MVPESSIPPLSSFETSEPHTRIPMLDYGTAKPSTLAHGFPLAVLCRQDTPSPD